MTMWDGFTDIKALTTAGINNTGVPNIISIHCCESHGYFWVQVQRELVTWAGWQKTGVAKETGHNERGGWLSHRGWTESRQQCLACWCSRLSGGPAFVFLPLWLCQFHSVFPPLPLFSSRIYLIRCHSQIFTWLKLQHSSASAFTFTVQLYLVSEHVISKKAVVDTDINISFPNAVGEDDKPLTLSVSVTDPSEEI